MKKLSGTGEPTFGVVPSNGVAVDYRHPAGGVQELVEFDRQGHRVRAVQYVSMVAPGQAPSAVDSLDRTYNMVQLRTPRIPALELTPKTGAYEPHRFTPIEDAVITRLSFGMLRAEGCSSDVETDTELDDHFQIEAEDPELARAMLTPAVRELLTTDSWFRTKQLGFSGGALWALETGGLSQDVALANSRHLANLAATIDPDAWRAGATDVDYAADTADAGEFIDVVRTADTGDRAWYAGVRRGPRTWTNQRRHTNNRLPLTKRGLVIRVIVMLLLLVPGLSVVGNALTAVVGLAPEVDVTVTRSYEGSAATCSECSSDSDRIVGFYEEDGVPRPVATTWMSFTRLPEEGEVVQVSLGPLWWNPVVEATDAAVYLVLLASIPLLLGRWLVRATFFPRPRKPAAT